MRNLRHVPVSTDRPANGQTDAVTDGQIETCHEGEGKVTFFCILDARSPPASLPQMSDRGSGGGLWILEDGATYITLTAHAAFPLSCAD